MYSNKIASCVNPSLICADPLELRSDVAFLYSLGIRKLHVDVMDNSFVPRFGIYPEILQSIVSEFDFQIDLHLMVSDVRRSLDEWMTYITPNAVSFHFLSNQNEVMEVSQVIRDAGAEVRIAYDLEVPDDVFLTSLDRFRPAGILFMGIKPGILVQDPRPLDVIKKLRLLGGKVSRFNTLQVDGGVNFGSFANLINSGATDLVCGTSTLFMGVKNLGGEQRRAAISDNLKKIEGYLLGSADV